jgi:DNA-binding CsgD family transcriptional regulator
MRPAVARARLGLTARVRPGPAAPARPGLAESGARPKRVAVSNPILAASDGPFRNRVLERLLAAGVDDPQVTDLPGALADLLQDTERSVVVVGGEWGATRPFLRVAVNSGALPVVLLETTALEAEGEALAMGARAALQFDIPVRSLAAALHAVDAGLIVLEPSARAILQSRQSPVSTGRRPLTAREREILSLVASGTSNKGIARALDVSANTVKFHLAAVFDKLNAATRAEAVAEAIRRGELSL